MSTRLQGTVKIAPFILGLLIFLWWLFAKTTFLAWTLPDNPYQTITMFPAVAGQPFDVELLLNTETNKCYYYAISLQGEPLIEETRCPI